MRRFSVILLGATALAWLMGAAPQAEAADAPVKVARIAYVSTGTASQSGRTWNAFRDRLRELGWVQGQNLEIDAYWAEGRMERLPSLMTQALANHPDVLVTGSTPGRSPPRRRPAPCPSWLPRWETP